MTTDQPTYIPYGSSGLLINWPEEISSNMLQLIFNYDKQLNNIPLKGFLESTPAYNSILINYDNRLTTHDELCSQLASLVYKPTSTLTSSETHKIPVAYNEEFGLDLQFLSTSLGLTKTEIIKIHSSCLYDVHFIGFLPGFMYLGGLDPRLHCPRRQSPRIKVPQGALAIGGAQTGIYPVSSPGGWHIIGKVSIQLFNEDRDPPVMYKIGDKIQFIPV